MSTEVHSNNPVVQAMLSGTAPIPAQKMAARGMLPLAESDLLEVLVALRESADAEVAAAAVETLAGQSAETLQAVAESSEVSTAVLGYLAGRADAGRAVHETVLLNARTPDAAVAELAAQTTEGALLEIISTNQQRLLRQPALIDLVLANPARTPEAERRVTELRREFFEKERGADQVAAELRARGQTAAAEFIESAESLGAAGDSAIDDAWFLAQHIEVTDDELDDSWLPSERLEEFYAESEEQRYANVERVLAETHAEAGEVAPERISLIRRVMMMNVKDRVKLARKGDRETRGILIRDSNKLVATAVINNPRITDQEVEAVAAMRTVSDEVLRIIAMNRQWARSYTITHNLARNPRTPIATAMTILPRLRAKDLETLAKSRNISETVRRQAYRLAQVRSGK
jgi:hypothetical protein